MEIGSSDGLRVWLNGVNLFKHNNPREIRMNKEVELLLLKAVKNQFLIKLNNRYGYELDYKTNRDIEQILYKQNLSPLKFLDINKCELKLYLPESEHIPIRMNNVSIQL